MVGEEEDDERGLVGRDGIVLKKACIGRCGCFNCATAVD
jgi:hypothetical protein